MSRATTCTYHCSACGCHFHSLASFDAHRVGKFDTDNPDERRRCEHPLDVLDDQQQMRLVALTETGVCRAYEAQDGITVWTMAASLERARETWGEAA